MIYVCKLTFHLLIGSLFVFILFSRGVLDNMQDLVFVWNALEGSCNSGVVLFLLNKKIAIKNVFADIL